jgi:hypothetical protein
VLLQAANAGKSLQNLHVHIAAAVLCIHALNINADGDVCICYSTQCGGVSTVAAAASAQ